MAIITKLVYWPSGSREGMSGRGCFVLQYGDADGMRTVCITDGQRVDDIIERIDHRDGGVLVDIVDCRGTSSS